MYTSQGLLNYGPGIRVIAIIDQGISDYYRSLIPKYYQVQPQKYGAHITIVRTDKESPKQLAAWGKYQGQSISFEYSPEIHFDGSYWYLNVRSQQIGDIREELGLPRFRFQELSSKDGCYHISIGNNKSSD